MGLSYFIIVLSLLMLLTQTLWLVMIGESSIEFSIP